MDQAILDVERAIGEVRNQLPPEANDPIVRERSDNDWPILIYSIYGFSNLRSGYAVAQETVSYTHLTLPTTDRV